MGSAADTIVEEVVSPEHLLGHKAFKKNEGKHEYWA